MKEIYNLILKVFTLRIPIPISFAENNIGYITLFGLFVIIMFFVIMSYVIYKLFK